MDKQYLRRKDERLMRLENAYSITGFAHVFKELDEHNTVTISKDIYGSGWDELVEAVVGLLRGMKCDIKIYEGEENVRITVSE
jgi:hypothetical protein